MDPLSITASVVTVTAAAITVCSTIVTVIEGFKNAPEEILFLHNDISDTMIILSNITVNDTQNHSFDVQLALPDSENDFGNPEIIAKAEIIIGRVERVLRQINVLLQEIVKSRSQTVVTLHHRSWLKNRSRLRILRCELRELKANLAVYFSASTCSYAHRSVTFLKRALIETATSIRHQHQHNSAVDSALQKLNDRLSELINVPASQRQLVNMIESLSMTLTTSTKQTHRTPTPTTEEYQTSDAVTTHSNIQQSGDNRSLHQVCVATETESFSRLKLEFSRFQKKGCVSNCECICHLRHRYRSPSFAQRFLGELYVGITNMPLLSRSCTDGRCRQKSPFSATLTYYLPTCMFRKLVSFVFITTSQGDPAACLKIRPISTDFSIYRAIERNDVQVVRSIIERKAAHPSAPFMGGWTPLHYAIDNGNAAICRTLIASGADVHVEDGGDQISALEAVWLRILSGFYESDVQAEMEQIFSDRDCVEEIGLTKLHRIVLGLERGPLAPYLAEHPDTINVADAKGQTALLWAARRAMLDELTTLLRAGADPNICTPGGHSPLLFAAEAKRPDCIQLLLDYGADVHARDPEGQTALHYAAQHRGDIRYYEPLVAARADVNHATKNELTVLITVILSGHTEAMKFLVKHGADINLRGQQGRSPIFFAVEYNHHEALEFLLAQGADFASSSDKYPTIAHVAAHHADVKSLRILTNFKLALEGVECIDHVGLTIPQILESRLETFIGDKTELADAFGAFLASINVNAGDHVLQMSAATSDQEDDMDDESAYVDAVEHVAD